MDQEKHCFIDECGNTNLNVEVSDVGTHYVLTAVTIQESHLESILNDFEEVREKHFQTGEMKSSKVGSNDKRRLKIIRDLCEIDFILYCVVIDKRELQSEGYKYADVFFKNLYGKLYQILFEEIPGIKIEAHQYSDTPFMKSFKNYLQKRTPPNLFLKYDVEFVNSKKNPGVQAADFIGGSIARHFDETLQSEMSGEFMDILSTKFYSIEFFPPQVMFFAKRETEPKPKEVNHSVQCISLNKVNSYISQNEMDQDFEKKLQIRLLRILRRTYFFDKSKFLCTYELLKELNEMSQKSINERKLKTQIIGSLRSSGVLIVSREAGGYKIPSTVEDIYGYLIMASTNIIPQLHRISTYRKIIKKETNNNFDILEDGRFEKLRKVINRTPEFF